MLTREEQDEILHNSFSPDGELKFSIGRISMNANDYALSWYSCSDVHGDFDNKYFNIERDKTHHNPLYPCGTALQSEYDILDVAMESA